MVRNNIRSLIKSFFLRGREYDKYKTVRPPFCTLSYIRPLRPSGVLLLKGTCPRGLHSCNRFDYRPLLGLSVSRTPSASTPHHLGSPGTPTWVVPRTVLCSKESPEHPVIFLKPKMTLIGYLEKVQKFFTKHYFLFKYYFFYKILLSSMCFHLSCHFTWKYMGFT